jgi:rRNA-processing protein FCF1
MIVTRLHVKPGADPAAGARRLAELIMLGGNVSPRGAGPQGMVLMRDAYLDWIEQVESCLSSITADLAPVSELFTAQYWAIRSLSSDWREVSDPRPYPLVYGEVSRQIDRLRRLLDDLNARLTRASAAAGSLTVVDTNVLLHYLPVDQIPWPGIVGSQDVRLVIPLRVIEELDAKKYAKRQDLSKRARNILPALERLLGQAGAPGRVTDGVTVEVPVETGPRDRSEDADEVILETCRELGQFAARPVALVTGDYGMRLRAQALGIRTMPMPEKYLRRGPLDTEVTPHPPPAG